MFFRVEVKPTTHPQRCAICRHLMKKGKLRIIMRVSGYKQTFTDYAHPQCMVEWIKKETEKIRVKEKGNKAINPSRREEEWEL